MQCRKQISDHDTWLKERLNGIGASESAAIVGLSPYMSANELWELKMGIRKAKDISDNEVVARGVALEPALRHLFSANHSEMQVDYFPYDLISQEGREWLFATLDGELTDEDGHKGILEIKTASPNGSQGWSKWDNQIPSNYYIQNLHQLLATGYDFVILYAALFTRDGQIIIREYRIDREDVEAEMEWLLKEENIFWEKIQSKELPSVKLVL